VRALRELAALYDVCGASGACGREWNRPTGAPPLRLPLRGCCRIANIVCDHAMILPDDATPKLDGIFGKDNPPIHRAIQHMGRIVSAPAAFITTIAESSFQYTQP
jgi:hypothetical protein